MNGKILGRMEWSMIEDYMIEEGEAPNQPLDRAAGPK
jgi:hypothetical protein